MPQPRILILRAPGTNCDHETAYAFERAGGKPELVHVNRLLTESALLQDFQVLCIPGGFSYGDDVAAGRILANQIRHHLAEVLQKFKGQGKLILGICNGFQVLIKSGVLLPENRGEQAATLTWNDSGKYECRWVQLAAPENPCVFLHGVDRMYLPIAHAEGKFVARNPDALAELQARRLLALRYCDANGETAEQPLPFPLNPNGSDANVAGVCDPTGRVFGLMPHPERHIDATHHPQWTRGGAADPGDGLLLFRNGVAYYS